MVAALRTLRVAGRIAMPRPAIVRAAAVPSVAQRAAFSVSARRFKSDVVKETEVPVSVYTPDSKGVASGSAPDHFTISVKEGAAAPPEPEHEEEVDESVTPLNDKVFKAMPRTLQRMTVHDKVIIITG